MNNQITRRGFVAASSALLSLCAAPKIAVSQEAAIKLGFTGPLSGAQQALGTQQLLGAQIAVKMINDQGGIGGKTLELVVRDDAGDPNRGVANFNEFAGMGIRLALGAVQSSVVLAVKPLLERLDMVFISTAASADQLTHSDFVPNYFRISEYFGMVSRAQAKLLVSDYPEVTSWTALVADAAFGQSALKSFTNETNLAYQAAGKALTFTDPVLFKFGSTDFRNQVVALLSKPAEGIFITASGSDSITFYTQAVSLGLFDKFKVAMEAGGEVILGNAMGSRIPAGLWTNSHWYYDLHRNDPYADYLIKEATGELGDERFISGYIYPPFAAILAYAKALDVTGGDTATQGVISALEGMELDTPKGKVTIRARDHQVMHGVDFFQYKQIDADPGWGVERAVTVAAEDAALEPTVN